MKPAAFDYYQPDNLAESLLVIGELGSEARVLAGGQSLVPMLNIRMLQPAALIDISQIEELALIKEHDDYIEVGAAVTQAELLAYVNNSEDFPLLKQALPWTGHYQTRQRGTVCGSLVHSDPSSELPLCLKVLGAQVIVQSGRKKRVVEANDFQTGLLQTDVGDEELVTAVRFPRSAPSSRFLFNEVSQRHGDFAIVALAVEAQASEVRVGVAGVADAPVVQSFPRLVGEEIDDALNDFAWNLGGADDVHATARYRRELVRRLGKSMIEELT